MSKKTKSNTVNCDCKIAKKKPVLERGLFDWIGHASRWFVVLIRVYHVYEMAKSLLDSIGSV